MVRIAMDGGRLLLLALSALLVVPGCTWFSKATREPTQALGQVLLSQQEEQRLGAELAAQIKQQEPVLKDPEVQRYVSQVGQLIVNAVPEEQRRSAFEFTVLDTPDTVNAFALPGGYIFVNSGLLRAVDNEAELAAVLGHEVAHVTLDHPSQQMASQVGLSALTQIALGDNPGMVAQLASAIAGQGYLAAGSREAESESDRRGMTYLVGAGYSARSMPSFFVSLERASQSNPNVVERFFASHPDPGARAQDLQQRIDAGDYRRGRTSIVGGLDRVQAQVGGPKIGEADGKRSDSRGSEGRT